MADPQWSKFSLLWELPFEGSWPTSVAFVGDGMLVAGNERGQLLLWELPDKAEKGTPAPMPTRSLVGHTNGITRLVATPDGKSLLSASLDHTVRLWDPSTKATGTAELILDAETREREAKRKRAKPSDAPGVRVETVPAMHTLAGHGDWVRALGVSADGRWAISGDDRSQVIIWDLTSRKEVSRWSGLAWNWIFGAALSPDGQTAAVSEYRYKRDDFDRPAAALRLWETASGREKRDILKIQFPAYKRDDSSYGGSRVWRKFVAGGLLSPAFSPDGKLLAVGQSGETDTGKVHLLEVATGKLHKSITGHRYGVTDLTFSADGQHVVSVGRDTSVRVTGVKDGKEAAQFGKPRGGQFKDWLHAVAVSPGQRWLAAADIAGKILVWRVGA